MMASNYATNGVSRYLTSLIAGGAMVKDHFITLPRGASESMRFDAEYVCTKGNRYDYRHEEDAA